MKYYIAGHRGLVGGAILRRLEAVTHTLELTASREEFLNLDIKLQQWQSDLQLSIAPQKATGEKSLHAHLAGLRASLFKNDSI